MYTTCMEAIAQCFLRHLGTAVSWKPENWTASCFQIRIHMQWHDEIIHDTVPTIAAVGEGTLFKNRVENDKSISSVVRKYED